MPDLDLVRNDVVKSTTAPHRAMDPADDLSRNVFGLLGVPLDAIDFSTLIHLIDAAAQGASPFLISTPNVNFLIKSQTNGEFRDSMLLSDLCLADGMPLIWMAKLLGIPIHERIAGSDLFGRLKSTSGIRRRLKVFLLGGAEGLAAAVGAKLNAEKGGLECVGFLNPGFGTIDEMSSPEIIGAINASHADLIAVFFGAEKAQGWLLHNHLSLDVPIRAQFGATINFEAGTVRRAPLILRSTGFEWLWRIKEEPYLWRRYWNDGKALLKLFVSSVLPLMVRGWRMRSVARLFLDSQQSDESVTIHLVGGAVAADVEGAIKPFRNALNSGKQIILDLSRTGHVDARFFGLFLMLSKELGRRGQRLRFIGVTPLVRRIFRLNRFEFLLSQEIG
ncbi:MULTISPECIES: WecB/TagA/CpsF family glycosyltransferase [Bradyrhizobium]|uniref:N-acetylglucosaminyldiphosphoundecaprenol N-acetyl-beta-D-mannosaminyltransferase n=2 Tax=Bradyrhizobium TaxID=374 RepID=A0ABY0Q7D8_9BRAD|nr:MULTISPECIES: WecB/TagA/CpsF family glycosyltransferase [Bradyrhizobium]SDJ64059.1 N-acetylglucosaminyldiphosphoundecaprenol N-acetyl-beta-D-mannosaminyltransferase [Bradyrhizobium ottawaense]SEC32533.1 N-acetylglucosaminyldiphosphoundecaprenol N-acetyl-beta-D-mannosaminyltransferase [Bradyrhizobium lablabi]